MPTPFRWRRIARSTSNLRSEFGLLVAAVLLGGIFASTLIAITVTKRGLRPLSAMTRSLMRVGPKRLHERVPPADWPRELQPVAIAFDDMLDRLEDSFTRLSQFSADLAHELRTPLANIRGEAEVALTRPRSPNEYEAVIESSVAECARLSGIIDNLLFLARAEAAESKVQRSLFDGRSAIERIAAYNEAIAEERQLTITCQGDGRGLCGSDLVRARRQQPGRQRSAVYPGWRPDHHCLSPRMRKERKS